jgi:hypothetical protein
MKLSIKKHSVPRLGLGGLSHNKRRANYQKGDICQKISKDTVYETGMSIVLSLYPKKNSAIASGATPIGSAVAHPIERSRQKGEELKSIIKNQLMDKWFRRNRLYFVSNELRLHCRQNKHRLLPSGVIYESCKGQLRYFVY